MATLVPVPELRDRVAYRFERLLNQRVLMDSNVFYEDCRSTDAGWVLAVKNLLAPERLLARARYAQALGVPVRFSRAEPAGTPPADLDPAEVARLVAEFERNGVVQLSGDRSELARSTRPASFRYT